MKYFKIDFTEAVVLPSGITAFVNEFTGKDLDLLMNTSKKNQFSNFRNVLASILVQYGEVKVSEMKGAELEVFLDKIPLQDKNIILIHARNISMYEDGDFKEGISDNVIYDKDGYREVIDISEGIPYKAYQTQSETFESFDMHFETTLPSSKKQVRIPFATVRSERNLQAKINKEDFALSDLINSRNPVEVNGKDIKKIDCRKLNLKDIKHLRKEIKEREAEVMLSYELKNGKSINLMLETDFFTLI